MFEGWDNVYLMLGPAASGLIGLLFVVVTLTAGFDRSQALRGQAVYLTPTALHFGVIMAISAVAMAPRLGVVTTVASICIIALLGAAGAVRACFGIQKMRTGNNDPHWSDFWCYGAAPVLLSLGVCAATLSFLWRVSWAAEAIAALLLVLLLLNIRNAWDLITAIVAMSKDKAGG
jgi:hypothetical protein